MQSDGGLAPIN